MANASGSSHYWAIEEELTAFGTTPSPFNPTIQRFLEGTDASDNRSSLVSAELTSDRQIRSSTLGTPQPEFSPSFELSSQSFSMLLEGALQGNWVGNGYSSALTVDVSAGNTLTTDGGETWASLDFADGDVITLTGLTVSSEDGSYLISSGSSSDVIAVTDLSGSAVTFTAETDATLTVIGGRSSAVIDVSSNNVTVDATAKTLTSASGIWTETSPDLRYGDLIYLAFDASASSTNGYYKVSSATSTVLTVTDGTNLTSETLSTGNLEVANNSAFLVAGSTKHSYSVESGYTDVDEYRTLRGAQVGDLSLSYGVDSIITGDFSMMGTELSAFDVTPESSSTTNPLTTPVFNSFRGFASIDSGDPGCITDISISLSNNMEALQCIFSDTLSDLVSGRSNASGSFTAYFADSDLANKYSDETPIAVFIVAEDADGRTLAVGMDNCQIQSYSMDVAETTVSINADYQALYSDDTYMNIYFIESREIPT